MKFDGRGAKAHGSRRLANWSRHLAKVGVSSDSSLAHISGHTECIGTRAMANLQLIGCNPWRELLGCIPAAEAGTASNLVRSGMAEAPTVVLPNTAVEPAFRPLAARVGARAVTLIRGAWFLLLRTSLRPQSASGSQSPPTPQLAEHQWEWATSEEHTSVGRQVSARVGVGWAILYGADSAYCWTCCAHGVRRLYVIGCRRCRRRTSGTVIDRHKNDVCIAADDQNT